MRSPICPLSLTPRPDPGYPALLPPRYYLVLSFEHSYRAPTALGQGAEDTSTVKTTGRQSNRTQRHKKGPRVHPKARAREFVLHKKERARQQGKSTKGDSKYSGRKRRDRF